MATHWQGALLKCKLWPLNTMLHGKEQLGGGGDSILAKAIYKRRLVYLAVPERKQIIKTNRVVSKGLRTNSKYLYQSNTGQCEH